MKEDDIRPVVGIKVILLYPDLSPVPLDYI
jgi:hypothetical protein